MRESNPPKYYHFSSFNHLVIYQECHASISRREKKSKQKIELKWKSDDLDTNNQEKIFYFNENGSG